MHIGQPAVDAVVADGQAFVVDAQEVHDGGVDVIDLRRVQAVLRFVAPLVGLADGGAAFDAAACEPVGEDIRIVIAADAALRRRHAAKLSGPEDDCVLEHAALFEVFDEC